MWEYKRRRGKGGQEKDVNAERTLAQELEAKTKEKEKEKKENNTPAGGLSIGGLGGTESKRGNIHPSFSRSRGQNANTVGGVSEARGTAK